jgi:DNA-binding GntR family transcriptional regulator
MSTAGGARAPKYQRIADELRRRVREGEHAAGERMPAETDLAEQFRVSLPTIRQALGVLRAEGLIESRHGIGTFVKEHRRLQRRSRHRYGRARSDKRLLTSHLQHEILFAGRELTPAHIAEVMPEPPAEIIARRRILRDPETGQVEEIGASFVPTEIAAGTFLEEPAVVPKALFLCVEDLSGKTYAYARDRWLARMPTADEADTLGLAPGAAVVHVIHTAEADDGTILEISESVWPAERVMILDEYPITADADELTAPSEV